MWSRRAHLQLLCDGHNGVLVLVHDGQKDLAAGGQLLAGCQRRLGIGLRVGHVDAHHLPR